MNTKLFRLIIVSLMLCMMLTSCFAPSEQPDVTPGGDTEAPGTSETPDTTVTYKVTFLNGEEVLSTVDVKDGETVSAPNTPAIGSTIPDACPQKKLFLRE